MSKNGYWIVYKAPQKDEQSWFITEEDSRDKSQKRHDYPDQQTAQQAYIDLCRGAMKRKRRRRTCNAQATEEHLPAGWLRCFD